MTCNLNLGTPARLRRPRGTLSKVWIYSEAGMSATDKVFAGSVPKLYDEYLVPLIFAVYADDMARRVAALSPSTLLEIAAGTGAVTRAVAAALPADVRYVATDLNEPMLAVAMQRQVRTRACPGARRTRWPCPSTMPRSMSSAASSAPCSFRTGPKAMRRRSGS
jgi:hypothetical protein